MGFLSKAYLVTYNVVQVLGWTYMMALASPMLETSLVKGQDLNGDLFKSVGPVLKVFQTAAILEVAHAAVGLVRSNPAITAFQVASRVFVTWAILEMNPESRVCRGFPLLLLAWTITEIVRYSFYACGLLGITPGFLTWLRYTLFIVLYPIGITGELWCQYVSLDRIARENMFSVRMPNKWNFAFDFHAFLICIMLSYIPIFPQLYLHMFAQRKKVVGGKKTN